MSTKNARSTARRRARRATSNNNNGVMTPIRGSNRIGATVNSRFGLPMRYPLPTGDVVPATLKFTYTLLNNSTGNAAQTLVWGKGATTASIKFLDNVCAGFGQMALIYSRFLIKRIRLQASMTGGINAVGYIAANYEAIPSLVPTSLADVSNAVHTLHTVATNADSFVVTPTDYYNDWRSTVGDGELTNDGRMGTTQLYSFNAAASGVDAGIVSAEIEILFAGYRL
jgi:hypothetical protein